MASRPLPRAASVPTRNGPVQPSGSSPKHHVLDALEQDGAEHGRHEQQEREAGSAVAIEAEETARGDRDPRARDAGSECERLRAAHDDRVTEPEIAHRAVLRRAVCPEQEQRAGGEQDEDLPGLAEVVRDEVGTGEADDAGGDRRDEHEPRDPLVRRLDLPTSHGAEPGTDETDDVVPEVRADGDERPEVERHVERLVEAVVLLEVCPFGGPGDEDEMARGRDRQELGQTLHDPEHESLRVRECVGVVPHSGQRQDDGKAERRPRDAEHDGAAHGWILRSARVGRAWEEFRRKLRQYGERAP